MATNNKYKTLKEIEQEAKEYGMQFVVSNINFNDPKQRVITVAAREEIDRKQDEMLNGKFENFVDKLYTLLPQIDVNVFSDLEKTYYGRTTYSLAIASGADINLDKVIDCLRNAGSDLTEQRRIVNQLNAQLNVAALKGAIRDYYTSLIVVQNGYENKASRSLMGNFALLLENAAFYVDASMQSLDPDYLHLLKNLNDSTKQIRAQKSLSLAEELTKQSNKVINNYTNTSLQRLSNNPNPRQ